MLELYEQNREIPTSRSTDPSGYNNHDKKALPPGTPQVVEKRPVVEMKSRTTVEPLQQASNQVNSKPSLDDLEQVNIAKLKTAVEKRRKLKSEGEAMRSKLELTDEEELLERGMENANRDCQPEKSSLVDGQFNNPVHNSHYSNSECGGGKIATYNTEFVDVEDLEIDHVESSSETKQWRHLQLKEHSLASQTRRTNEIDYHNFHQKGKDWAERENKRSHYEHVK